MRRYQVVTITNKRVLVEEFTDKKTALSLLRVAKYGFPEGEYAKKAYLTKNYEIIIEQNFKL